MNIAYFGYNQQDYAPRTIINQANKKGHVIFFFNVEKILFYDAELIYNDNIIDVQKFDVAIVRSHGKIINNTHTKKRIATFQILRKLHNNNIPILNGNFLLKNPFFDKLSQSILFRLHSLPTIPTIHPISTEFATKINMPWKFPVIIKEVEGSFGMSVYKLNSHNTFNKWITQNLDKKIIIQKFIKNNCDYRTIVCGNKILGTMQRQGTKSSWLHNFSQGATIKKVHDIEIENLALHVSKKLQCDYVGVDIIRDQNNKLYIVEINLAANFKGFEKVHGNNYVASHIIDTLITDKLY